VLIYSLACIGTGLVTSKILGKLNGVKIEYLVKQNSNFLNLEFLIGIAVLSVFWQLLGLAGQLYDWILWVVIIGLAGAVFCFSRQFTNIHFNRLLDSYIPLFSKRVLFFILIPIVTGLSAWYGILAYVRPPFGDADAFYMTYPKIIAASGVIKPMAGNYFDFSSIGLSGELHYAALFALGANVSGVKLFAWVAGINLLLLLIAIVRLCGGGIISQALTLVMALTSTTVTDYFSDGKTDLFATALTIGGLYCLILAKNANNKIILLSLSGFLVGLSLVAKFSFIIVVIPAFLVIFAFQYRFVKLIVESSTQNILNFFFDCFIFSAALILATLPHFLKNYVLFKNAFAPFIGQQSNWADQSWYSFADATWIVLTYPIAMVFGLYPLMGGNLSFLWLATLPLIFFFKLDLTGKNKLACQLMIAGVIGVCAWLCIKPSVLAPRYILPVLLMMFPLPAIAAEKLFSPYTHSKLLAIAFLSLVMIAGIAAPLSAPAGVWTALPHRVLSHIKYGGNECSLSISSYCSGFLEINERRNQGDRIFLAGYYSFHLEPELLQCVNTIDETATIQRANSANVWRLLYLKGFSFIAIQKATHISLLEIIDAASIPEWLDVETIMYESDMPIFHIQPKPTAPKTYLSCQETAPNIWQPVSIGQ